MPFEYIRQVCMLPAVTAGESEDQQSEYGQEAIVAENNRLVATYREFLAKRYLQSLELHACIYQATRKGFKGAAAEEPREDRISEGERVTEILEFGSVIPERENLPYYIVGMAWFQRW